MRLLAEAVGALVAAWFLYVPVHELLHAAGCSLAGGSVTRLEIAPQYGGTLLARLFPLVVAGGDYAGRLSGFDTHGSDLIYLATDFAPYVLSVLVGVPLMRICTRRRRPVLFGVAVVIGLAPFYNAFGDYYEMGSIITTRVVTLLGVDADPVGTGASAVGVESPESSGVPAAFGGIRSDDVFRLVGDVVSRPGEVGLHSAREMGAAMVLILASLLVGLLLAMLTYRLGDAVAAAVVGAQAGRTEPGG